MYIAPENEAVQQHELFVNGKLITERQRLYHGDRVVIGRSHFFRVVNPVCRNASDDMVRVTV